MGRPPFQGSSMELDPAVVIALVPAVFAAAIVNGITGFGFALVAVNVLAVALGAKDAIIVLSLLTPFVSGLQLWRYRRHSHTLRRVRVLVIAAMIGTAVGARILVFLPGYAISLALGLFTVIDALVELRGRRPLVTTRTERRLAPAAGFVGGVTNGALGAAGPVLGSYLLAVGIRGADFAFAISAAFFTMSLVRNGALAVLGQYTPPAILLAVALLAPAIAGLRAGFWLRGRLAAPTVERAVLVVLLLASLNLLYQGTRGLIAVLAAG